MVRGIRRIFVRLQVRHILLGVLGLVSVVAIAAIAWNANRTLEDRELARWLVRSNQMWEASLRLDEAAALERGITSIILAGTRDVQGIDEMHRQRLAVDRHHTEVVRISRMLIDADPELPLDGALRRLLAARAEFMAARSEADRVVEAGIDGDVDGWIEQASSYIETVAQIRRAASRSADPYDRAMHGNLHLKEILFVATEHAGRERAIIGGVIASGRRLNPAELRRLTSYRTLVETSLQKARAEVLQIPFNDGIRAAFSHMETGFLDRFEKLREAVYSASSRGDPYPVSPLDWYRESTAAIGTILELSDAIGRHMRVDIVRVDQKATWLLIGLFGTCLLVLAAFVIAYAVIRLRILLPLVRLCEASRKLGSGELQTPLPLLEERDEFSVMRDVLESMRINLLADIERLVKSQEELRTLYRAIDQSVSSVVITDRNGVVEYVNPQFTRTTGYTGSEVIGRRLDVLSAGETNETTYKQLWATITNGDVWEGELLNRKKDGTRYWELVSISPVTEETGAIANFVGIYHDVTQRKFMEERLNQLAYYDELTGLPNRALFNDRLNQAIAYAQRKNSRFAVLFIDLDRFKLVNDSLGHDAGDTLIQTAAARIRHWCRAADTVARYGGDEFVLLMLDVEGKGDVSQAVHRLLENIGRPLDIGGREIRATCSIGASIYPDDGVDGNILLRNADAAMYRAKYTGRNRLAFYTEDLSLEATQRLDLESELRRALEQEEFVLYYQPQVSLPNRQLIGMEALIRWSHPVHGLLTPERFLSVAEETGLIVEIGAWVLQEACRQARRWQGAAGPEFRVAVNVSARQLGNARFIDTVESAIEEAGISPGQLELEITESAVIENIDAALAILERLKTIGVRLAVDDFGTGYSSLSYLQRFPFDKLKIDRFFVRNITDAPDKAAIVAAITGMARILKMVAIAEGVETERQARYLRDRGCDEIQGYLISPPVPATEASRLMRAPARMGAV